MATPSSSSVLKGSSSNMAPAFDILHPRPDLPPSIAAITLRKLIALNLQTAGFDSTSSEALEELEGIVNTFFEVISRQSHELAELGRRNGVPNFRDIITSCGILGVGGIKELKEETRMRYNQDETNLKITYSPSTSSALIPPPLLTSSASAPVATPPCPPSLEAPYLPPLPPAHVYEQTPVYPHSPQPPLVIPASAPGQQGISQEALGHLSVLRLRLSDSRLVSGSLRSLVKGIILAGKEGSISSNSKGENAKGKGVDNGSMAIITEAVSGNQAVEGEEGDDDIIDFEGEWYGGMVGKGRKRTMGLIRVSNPGEKDKDDALKEENEEDQVVEEKRMGGAGKRRKWRV